MKNKKVWFVTGASRGFGFEIVKAALETGANVVATVRSNPDQLEERLRNPENLMVTVVDVTDKDLVENSVTAAVNRFGRIDVLVNNAGYGLLGAIEEVSEGEIRQNYETNVFGLLWMTQAVLPQMRIQKAGHIVNFSSVGGLTGFPGWGIYCSTKFAIEGLTESLALELAHFGIHATTVEPGFFRTEFLDDSSLTAAENIIADYSQSTGNMRDQMKKMNLNQPGDPAKLASAVVELTGSDQPPIHLMLGGDTLDLYQQKQSLMEKEIEAWKDTITGTNFD